MSTRKKATKRAVEAAKENEIPRVKVCITKEFIDLTKAIKREQEEREESAFLERVRLQAEANREKKRFNKAVEQMEILLSKTETTATGQPNALERLKNISKHPNAATAINWAIELGYIINNGSTLKWTKTKTDLAYFTEKLCRYSNKDKYPNTKLCELFEEKNLKQLQNQIPDRNDPQTPYIDKLFS